MEPSKGEILTVAELAEYLKLHRDTIYKLAQAREIPSFKIGYDWRFKRERIDEWRRAQEKSSEAETPSATRSEKDAPPTRPRSRRR